MQAGAATAVAAPLLRPSQAEAEYVKAGKINKAENGGGKAPVLCSCSLEAVLVLGSGVAFVRL